MGFKKFNALILAFAGLASAGGPPIGSPPGGWNQDQWSSWATVSSRCYTRMATTSIPWARSTSYTTSYATCSPSTTTITSTVTTPPPSTTTTVTSTVTTTTTAPTTSFTSTVTATTISSATTTVTTTVTTNSTLTSSVTATTTISTSSGFLAVQTTLPGLACDQNCGPDPVTKRKRGLAIEIENRAASYNNAPPSTYQPPTNGSSKYQYPQGVLCQQFPPPVCSTSTKTTTTTVQGTSTGTVTATTTTTVTSTINPSATVTTTTTSTVTTTNTGTNTQTSTATTTTTSTVSTTTLYAACATNNLADQYNGVDILNIYGVGDGASNVGVDTLNTNTPYGCCVAAITDPHVSVYFQWQSNVCSIGTNNGAQCTSQADNQFGASVDLSQPQDQYVIGNAYCGEINQATVS